MEFIDLKETEGIPEGLTSEEAAALKAEGKVNISDERVGKSYGKIIRDNLFTYFRKNALSAGRRKEKKSPLVVRE